VSALATIKDVAKLAGVSISTVSYALNASEKVSETTREKVILAAKELNYVPNNFAKGLKRTSNNLIAVLVHEMFGPFYDNLIKGIQDTASLVGYDLVVFIENGMGRNTSVSFLKQNIVKGVIIMTSHIKDEDIKDIASHGMPTVILDRKFNAENVSNVLIDNEKGAYLAMKHLLDLGHRRIAFISGPESSYDNLLRLKGYKKALKENSIDFDKSLVINADFTENTGYTSVKRFIETVSVLPTAFFSSNDEMAIGALKAFSEKKLSVPKDISLVGFDDIKELKYISPELTTVHRPMYELGSYSAHLLINVIEKKTTNNNLMLDVKLIIRGSTDRYRR
jgi:LacI family transcriptional regulator